MQERITCAGTSSRCGAELIGVALDRLWPVEEAPHFDPLLRAIDHADEKFRRSGIRPN